jgi:hypothetical protein
MPSCTLFRKVRCTSRYSVALNNRFRPWDGQLNVARIYSALLNAMIRIASYNPRVADSIPALPTNQIKRDSRQKRHYRGTADEHSP